MNKYIKTKTYDQIYNKVLEIEDNEVKEKIIIISQFLKDRIFSVAHYINYINILKIYLKI